MKNTGKIYFPKLCDKLSLLMHNSKHTEITNMIINQQNLHKNLHVNSSLNNHASETSNNICTAIVPYDDNSK